MKTALQVVLTVVLAVELSCSAWSQVADPPKPSKPDAQQTITREQADEIIKELRAIRQMLEHPQSSDAIANELRQMRQVMERQQQPTPAAAPQAPPPPPQRITIKLGDVPALGDQDASVVLVEFSDYQCPFCRAFHSAAFAELKKNFIDTGKLRFISRDVPLDFHDNAARAAQAARCAGEQNKFWEMRDLLIKHADQLGAEAVLGYAQQLSVDMKRFKPCVAGDKYLQEIRKQAADANTLGISGTPSFVLGKMNGNLLDGVVLVGAQPYSFFEGKVKELLTK